MNKWVVFSNSGKWFAYETEAQAMSMADRLRERDQYCEVHYVP